MVTLNNVWYVLPDQRVVLKECTFHLQSGEKVAVIGENGSGKSTLGLLMLGILQPTQGTIEWSTPLLPTERQILLQNPKKQVLSKTVQEELSLLPTFCGLSKLTIQQLCNDAIQSLSISPDTEMQHLSEGERLKVMVKAITIVPPKLIVTDEPANDLPPLTKQALMQDLMRLPSTLVWFTLSLQEAIQFPRTLVLWKGEIVWDTQIQPLEQVSNAEWIRWGIQPNWNVEWLQLP
ncbi:MAG: energy-coupling factor ABC transporter ATP-binding protein [bacterium]|nr:energy-coupling factor ABC transporter ATP-binding protein [bacterium]